MLFDYSCMPFLPIPPPHLSNCNFQKIGISRYFLNMIFKKFISCAQKLTCKETPTFMRIQHIWGADKMWVNFVILKNIVFPGIEWLNDCYSKYVRNVCTLGHINLITFSAVSSKLQILYESHQPLSINETRLPNN